jgi:hypothetical protein
MSRLGMIGGVKPGGGYWQNLNASGTAHSEGYVDYSQLYREYTHKPKSGYIKVGSRNGQAVYASPDYLRDRDGVYVMVSATAYEHYADKFEALLPRRSEVRNMLMACHRITMPTQNPTNSDMHIYTKKVDAAVAKAGIDPDEPISHGKEFYVVGT